jgi:hypothetical protein
MKKGLALITALFVVGIAGSASAALDQSGTSHYQAPTACSSGDKSSMETLRVRLAAAERVYSLGEKAKFFVKVNRVVAGQDLGPMRGADVRVGVTLGDTYLMGGGITDALGRVVVQVKLERLAGPGIADVSGTASSLVAELPCHLAYEYEYGSVEKLGLIRVDR